MATCYNDRLLYIHIPKCGGCSVGGTFDGQAWEGGYLPATCEGMRRHGLQMGHYPVWTIEQTTGRPVSSFDCILATIRNPFRQQVSLYRFHRARYDSGQRHVTDRAAGESSSLLEFVQDRRSNWVSPVSQIDPNCGGYYFAWLNNGHSMPCKVLRLEELDEHLPSVTAPYRVRDAELPRDNATEPCNWMDYYTPRTIDAVRRKFAWAFALWYSDQIEDA